MIKTLAMALALVANSALAQGPMVETHPLKEPHPGAAGLIEARALGLPVTLWQRSDSAELVRLIGQTSPRVPALRSLMRSLVLLEARPPGDGLDHLIARIDWLIATGAVNEALALLDLTGTDDPHLFSRWVDLMLLTGRSRSVCSSADLVTDEPSNLSLMVFCMARGGDWQRAMGQLESAQAHEQISTTKAELLWRFLDPEMAEEAPALLPPPRPTPLEFRLFEALGESLPTAPLPLAFSVLDLSGDAGWRAQIEAAERLSRSGSLSANRLLGIYTQKRPAASGGVWERAAGIQMLEQALSGETAQIEQSLQTLWPQMARAQLLVPFSQLYGPSLTKEDATGEAARIAARAALLSSDYETLSRVLKRADAQSVFLTAIARGDTAPPPQTLPHSKAVARAFSGEARMPDDLRILLEQGRLGEVILRTIFLFENGAAGNGRDLSDALTSFRLLGLEDVARRAALQLMILSAEKAL